MTRSDKRFARLLSIPADFTWGELVTVLERAGFVQIQGSRSRCLFVFRNGRKIFIHRPHPGKIMKRYALEMVVQTLKECGVIDGD